MHPNSLKNLKIFQPGKSGNPSGRGGTLPSHIRSLRKANQTAVIELLHRLLSMTDAEASAAVEQPECTQLHHAAQAIVGKARGGDVTAFKFLLEMTCGSVPANDYDGFSEEDLAMLNRLKELLVERQNTQPGDRAGH